MAKRKKQDSGGATSEWLNTYADMVTLLLTFFILLYSMSSLDAAKFNMLVRAFASDVDSSEKIVIHGNSDGEAQSGAPPALSEVPVREIIDLTDIYEALQEYIQDHDLQQSVSVSMGEGWVLIRFMNDMLFEPNSARLRQADLELLDFVGYSVKSIQGQVEVIRIDGHTAAIPDNPDYAVSDRMLSSERANNVLMYFEDQIGIDSSKLMQVGFGKWQPFTSNDTEEGRQQNRRVEIFLSGENLIAEELDAIYEKLVE